MAYEDRSAINGTYAMTCDTPDCVHECLSPGKDELIEDLNLAGWVAAGKNQAGDDVFRCPHCTQGVHPGQAALNRMTNGTGEVEMTAPMTVLKGDECHDEDGDLVGHYTADADFGEPVNVKVRLPDVPQPPDMIEVYDAMLEGTDADDDNHGRVSVVAPRPTSNMHVQDAVDHAQPTQPTQPAQPAQVTGAVLATGPDGPQHAPQLDTIARDRAAAVFGNFNPGANDWDPDDDDP